MKQTGKCPKCGGTNVIADAKSIDRGESFIEHDMAVATFRNPQAILFKGQQVSAVSAWVCGTCGFLELYADKPEAIRPPGS